MSDEEQIKMLQRRVSELEAMVAQQHRMLGQKLYLHRPVMSGPDCWGYRTFEQLVQEVTAP